MESLVFVIFFLFLRTNELSFWLIRVQKGNTSMMHLKQNHGSVQALLSWKSRRFKWLHWEWSQSLKRLQQNHQLTFHTPRRDSEPCFCWYRHRVIKVNLNILFKSTSYPFKFILIQISWNDLNEQQEIIKHYLLIPDLILSLESFCLLCHCGPTAVCMQLVQI